MTPPRRTRPTLTERDVAAALQRSVPDPEPPPDLAGQARARARRLRNRRRTAIASGVAAVAIAVVVPLLGMRLYGDAGIGPSEREPAGAPTSAHPCAGNPCSAATVRAAIQRPLTITELAPEETCPVSGSRRFPAAAGFSSPFRGVGTAPLYLAGGSEVGVKPEHGRWLGQKVIWVLDDSYAGAVLLRGTRIDGAGELRFLHYIGAAGYTDGAGDGRPHRELLYVRGGLTEAADETISSYPSGIFVDAPGCYAVQADGVGFSTTLVIQVRR